MTMMNRLRSLLSLKPLTKTFDFTQQTEDWWLDCDKGSISNAGFIGASHPRPRTGDYVLVKLPSGRVAKFRVDFIESNFQAPGTFNAIGHLVEYRTRNWRTGRLVPRKVPVLLPASSIESAPAGNSPPKYSLVGGTRSDIGATSMLPSPHFNPAGFHGKLLEWDEASGCCKFADRP